MIRWIPLILIAFAPASAAEPSWYANAVESIEAKIEPAEAKPGQTVKFTLTVNLKPGYHTYPLMQADKAAADMVNKLTFPAAGAVIFVGEPVDPPLPLSKAEPELGIKALNYYVGKVTYERTAVVSPKATAGAAAVKLTEFRLSVCDKENCFPSYKMAPEAPLKVAGPAVAVEAKYAAEVEKALKGN
jgi:hypothetical protein